MKSVLAQVALVSSLTLLSASAFASSKSKTIHHGSADAEAGATSTRPGKHHHSSHKSPKVGKTNPGSSSERMAKTVKTTKKSKQGTSVDKGDSEKANAPTKVASAPHAHKTPAASKSLPAQPLTQ